MKIFDDAQMGLWGRADPYEIGVIIACEFIDETFAVVFVVP